MKMIQKDSKEPISLNKVEFNKLGCRIHPEMADFLGYLLLKLALRIRTEFDAGLKIHGVLAPQIGMLVLLKRLGPMTQVELGQQLDIDKATMVRFLDSLEAARYLCRQAHATDRRAKVLVLTKSGSAFADKANKIRQRAEQKLLAPLSANEQELFRKLVTKMTFLEDSSLSKTGQKKAAKKYTALSSAK